MEFLFKVIYKTALDCARVECHSDIVDLLSKGPIKTSQKEEKKPETKSAGNQGEVESLKQENASLLQKTRQQEEIIARLKSFIIALKDKTKELQFFNFDDYKDVSVIGEGATSSVKLVIKKENEKYAKKELKDFTHKSMQRFISEGEILFLLHHPCILDIVAFNYGDDKHPPSLILSLEPSSLESAIKNKELNESQLCRITVEIVLGMRYIHHRNFMHRDLKPSNILLSVNNHVKISDFGLAKEENLETSQSKGVGTLRFMAPELFIEEEDEDDAIKYSNKVDVYSFGITLIYIVSGCYPKFNLRNVSLGVLPRLQSSITNWVRELIVRCLDQSPENRPSFAEIFEILKMNNYDLFNESKGKKLTSNQQTLKNEIDERVLEIEAFEFQHQDD